MTDAEPPRPPELKMWLAVRADLLVRDGVDDKPWYAVYPGKLATQSGHAYLTAGVAAMQAAPERFVDYIATSQAKIACAVKSLDQLRRVYNDAKNAGIPAYLVTDEGRTVFDGPTATVCAFGPAYRDELPGFLKRLQLL